MKDFRPVSCLCPTYGRREQLNEAVYSFLEQDYEGEKELLIVNDHPDVEYVFKHPEVRIINCRKRFDSLGEKLNYLFEEAKYDWLDNWPDDDIQFPWAISLQMAKVAAITKRFLGARTKKGGGKYPEKCFVFCPQGYFSLTNGGRPYRGGIQNLKRPSYGLGGGHLQGLIGCSKEAWKAVGGYLPMDRGEDVDFLARLRKAKLFSGFSPLKPSECYYIWRWGLGWPQMSKGHVRWYSKDKGRFKIEPGWQRDYLEETKHLRNRQL